MSVSRFFIDRPIFAWVVALIIMLAGIVSITRLPVSQYPDIAPPAVSVSASYPGADAQTVQNAVTQIIEENMTALDGLLYMSSSSNNTGSVSVTLTFANGTDPDIAQVQVQNRLQQAVPLLPQVVQQQGISVQKANNTFLMAVGFTSMDNSLSAADIADYVATNIADPISRVSGVGSINEFGSKYAMRIWLNPDRLNTYGLTPDDVVAAITAQNAQVSVGQLGADPAPPGQQINVTVTAQGRLSTPEQFRNIVLRSNTDGSTLRLGDVARVELGQADYGYNVLYNGHPASGVAVTMATGANALDTVANVKAAVARLQPSFPRGMQVVYPYDTTPFVRKSIRDVIVTLVEAIVLVFLVMFVFLQNIRATLVPAIAVPVVLLGTFGVLSIAGYSINMLTMFAVVLAIGLLVDDAIVVVENVERLMTDEGLSPKEATRRSMDQITGALIGIATVLSAVFIPMAFLQGATGVIYRQFSVAIVSAMVLSVIVAIVVSPALCATLLKPVKKGEHHGHRGFFRWFNATFDRSTNGYQGIVARMLRRPLRYIVIYVGLASLMALLFFRLPTAYLPDEDQGVLFLLVQAPVNATQSRTMAALQKVREYFDEHERGVYNSIFTISGFSYAGAGPSAGIGFVLLKDWSQRKSPAMSAQAIQMRANRALYGLQDAMVFAIAPPAVTQLGNTAGFDFYLKDDNGHGHDALIAARNQLLYMASKDRLLANVRPNGQEDAPQFRIDVDAQKAASLGVSVAAINDTLALAWGGRYIDDFIDRGHVKHVMIQADAPFRMQPGDFSRWYVRNAAGSMVSMASFVSTRWTYGPPQLLRFNEAPAVEINGEAGPGTSSGTAMNEIEKLVAKLPPGYSVDWAGESYQERAAGAQLPMLYALSIAVVFLCLCALYESWSIPTAILMAVPLGVIGAVIATALRGLERDIYFQVAMLTTIGLACKNAILIVEFAKEYFEAGQGLIEATLHAVRDRLRPILMTSIAFGLGVLPLAIATGAGAGAQHAIGTGVFGGMLAGTFLGIFFIPVFFVVVQRVFHSLREQPDAATAATSGAASPPAHGLGGGALGDPNEPHPAAPHGPAHGPERLP
ncbi:MAG TPA: efflux RND transporter permease subunit [Steroidobacteraceae bacterium]|jgi:multidrug efflux pump|nr:efflux RND transporter permease subunit [Steroidobacteraceae bacterium]